MERATDTARPPVEPQTLQAAIHRVALSLDSLLVNGLQYGVLQRPPIEGFLRGAADSLKRDVDALEEFVQDSPETAEFVAGLQEAGRQVAGEVEGLASFRGQPLEDVRSAVAQVLRLREECVRRIQQLEACLRTPKPFHVSRPPHSAAAVDAFLAGLGRAFTEEWSASAGQG
jgi:hypothetical protein